MITHGSPRFRRCVLEMNRRAIFDLFENLQEGCASGQSAGDAFDAKLRRARAAKRPLLARVAALRGYN